MQFLTLSDSAQYGIPGANNGFAGSPLVASWRAKVARGEAVTPAEHNAMVLSLAWCSDVLAARPGVEFPHAGAVERGANVLVLGGRRFEAGDLVIPAGVIAPPPVSPSRTLPDIRRSDGRRALWDQIQLSLGDLTLTPDVVRFVALPQQRETAPAGLGIVGIGITVGVILAVTGSALYGIWSARHAAVEVEQARQAGVTSQVRIQESGQTARHTASLATVANTESERYKLIQAMGRYIPPNPNLVLPDTRRPPDPQREQSDDLATVGKYLGAGLALTAALGAAAWVMDRAWARRQVIRSQDKGIFAGARARTGMQAAPPQEQVPPDARM